MNKIPAKTRKMLEEMILLLRDEHPNAKIPKGAFNIDYWRIESDCGTVACAMGWATMLLPSYRKLFTFVGVTGLVAQDGMLTKEKVLGLSNEQFDYLFQATWYRSEIVTAKQVARRIEKFLENGEIPARLSIF